MKMKTLCKIDNCSRATLCRQLCNRHYLQIQRHGKVYQHTIYDKRLAIIEGDIAKIPLDVGGKDGYTIVDKVDAYLAKHKWNEFKGYAYTNLNGTRVGLHQLILGREPGKICDHINHDRLDNRRGNLRLVTLVENAWNSSMSKRNTTGYKGVKWHKLNKNWNARIHHNGKDIHIGVYQTAMEAAKAYNDMAFSIRGQFAVLNKIGD